MTPRQVVVISRGLQRGIDRFVIYSPAHPLQHLSASSRHLYRWNRRLIQPRVGFYTPLGTQKNI
jgi:hypothetical protein